MRAHWIRAAQFDYGRIPLDLMLEASKEQRAFAKTHPQATRRNACYIDNQLRELFAFRPRLLEERLKVLDLGCGAELSQDRYDTRQHQATYPPWLSRYLYYKGLAPIGIDISKSVLNEPFEAYVADLMQPGALNFLPDHSVDIAYAANIVDSPYLWRKHGDKAGRKLLVHLMQQLKRIVKSNGVFVYSGLTL
jgi:SAM-dependent methyltransferase